MSDILFKSMEMAGKSELEKARISIKTVLGHIQYNPVVGYHLGLGTRTFGLLTEAAAALFREDIESVRKHFTPQRTANPAESLRRIRDLIQRGGHYGEEIVVRCHTGNCGECIHCIAARAMEECR